MRKSVFGISNQVRHKPGDTATDYCYMLGSSDLGSKMDRTIYAAKTADLRLCFHICRKKVFS